MHSHGSHTQIEAMRFESSLSPKVQQRRVEAEVQHQAARERGREMMAESSEADRGREYALMSGYKPYQIVALKGSQNLVELMSYPIAGAPEPTIFARLEIGEPTSAEYIGCSRLGIIVANSAQAYERANRVR